MTKKKIKGDGENKKQVKFGVSHGIIEVGKASKIKSNLQPNPTTATKAPRATCAQFLDGDSATSMGSLFQCLTTPSRKKIFPNIQDNSTSLLPNKLCHPCPGLERKGSTTGQWSGAGRAESKDTQDFSPVHVEGGVCGFEAFSKVSPSALKCPSSSGLDPASGASRRNSGTNAQTSTGTEEPLTCLLKLRNPTQNHTLNPIP